MKIHVIENAESVFPACDILRFENESEWHKLRSSGIGGSEAATVLNLNKYQSPHALWKLKTNQAAYENISTAAIEKGKQLESPLIEIFSVLNKQYTVYDTKNISLKSKQFPFMNANLDGFLIDDSRRRGILEIKTSTIQNKAMFEDWKDGNLPINYYCQILHYMAVTEAAFAVVFVLLDFPWKNQQELKTAIIERENVSADIELLIKEEEKFWGLVETKTPPNFLNKKITL